MDEELDTGVPEEDVVETEAEDVEDEAPDAEDEEGTEADEGQEEQEEAQPDKGRASSRIAKLANERREAAERAEKAERSVADLRAQMEEIQRRMTAPQHDPMEEARKLAEMDPIERIQYEANQKIGGIQAQIEQIRLQSLDSTDKATFLAKATNDPTRSKYLPQVEEALEGMRKKGLNAPREELYYYILGKSLAEQKAKGGAKVADKKAAQSRVASTQGRTTSARGDTAAPRKGKTAEDRLADIYI